jgi:hypothetical protein
MPRGRPTKWASAKITEPVWLGRAGIKVVAGLLLATVACGKGDDFQTRLQQACEQSVHFEDIPRDIADGFTIKFLADACSGTGTASNVTTDADMHLRLRLGAVCQKTHEIWMTASAKRRTFEPAAKDALLRANDVACADSSGESYSIARNASLQQLAARPASATATASERPMTEFRFPVQGGTDVTAWTSREASPLAKRVVVFSPFIERTDGNLYHAALQSLVNLYGKQRGLIQLEEARVRPEPSMGGNAICWTINNPTADYCVFPTKDTETGRIGALTVWIQ